MADSGLGLRHFTQLISACGVRWRQALWLFRSMPCRRVAPNVFHFNATMAACEKASQWRYVLALLAEMRLSADVVSFNCSISSCQKGEQWQKALQLFAAMPEAQIQCDLVSISCAISALASCARWLQALQLFQELPARRLRGDVVSAASAITACERSFRWQQALALWALWALAQRGRQADVVIYNVTISACEKARAWREALGLLARLRRRNLAPSAATCSAALAACTAAAKWQQALQLLLGSFGDLITCNAALGAFASAQRWELALWLLEALPSRALRPDAVSFDSVAPCLPERFAQLRRRGLSGKRLRPAALDAEWSGDAESLDHADARRMLETSHQIVKKNWSQLCGGVFW
ncbi:unnamed protein product [Effrenium voratum]|nr:unnamed protein product [Effrenium voratum]